MNFEGSSADCEAIFLNNATMNGVNAIKMIIAMNAKIAECWQISIVLPDFKIIKCIYLSNDAITTTDK